MSKLKAIGLHREIKLAGRPGSDQRILDFVAKEIENKGFDVSVMFPSQFIKEKAGDRDCDLIFSMARTAEINDYLSLIKDNKPVFIINSPASIRVSFNRFLTYSKVSEYGIRIPEAKTYHINDLLFSDLEGKVILKPANRHEYWFIVEKEFHFNAAMESYRSERIDEIMVQKFIKGEDVKFYAVGKKAIISNVIKERFSAETIKEIEDAIVLIGEATGLKIFGGDFIIDTKDNNKVYCVDINDWPSFGTIGEFSQEEAGIEIANLIVEELEKFNKKD